MSEPPAIGLFPNDGVRAPDGEAVRLRAAIKAALAMMRAAEFPYAKAILEDAVRDR
jgi:tetrahydrodipicolinate N-succinyltransferase